MNDKRTAAFEKQLKQLESDLEGEEVDQMQKNEIERQLRNIYWISPTMPYHGHRRPWIEEWSRFGGLEE